MLALRLALIWLATFPALASALPQTRATSAPIVRPRGVLIVSVDGLRPDLIFRADTPNLHGLMARGSFTMWALTVPVAITLPSHTSMLTGVPVEVHGVTWNGDPPTAQSWPARPTLFAVAKQAGYRTAMVAGKSKFAALAVPGTLDRCYVPPDLRGDSTVTDTATRWIREDAPQVLFVHLPLVDAAGHNYGWGSPEQITAVAKADRCIGRLLDALAQQNLLDSTVVLVTADHGGAGKTHGKDDDRSLHIPWIIAGPGIRQGYDLTQDAKLTVHTEDSFATVCSLLGIPVPDSIAGRVVNTAAPIAGPGGMEAHAAGH